jgi:hypothetical protein
VVENLLWEKLGKRDIDYPREAIAGRSNDVVASPEALVHFQQLVLN